MERKAQSKVRNCEIIIYALKRVV